MSKSKGAAARTWAISVSLFSPNSAPWRSESWTMTQPSKPAGSRGEEKVKRSICREQLPPEAFWLLLAHRNNYFEREYSYLGADLVISGHGHGGLIRLSTVTPASRSSCFRLRTSGNAHS